jgi:putative DNA primase/helicase
MVVGRFDAADGSKTYRPVHVLPEGSWAIGDPPGLLPLYALPWIEDADTVFVVEGEKCAHAIIDLGWATTTSAHGAESPHKTDWSPLAGKHIVTIPDHDVSGEGYAASVFRLLKRLDPRPRVKVVRLPGLADGEDFVEWSARIAGEGPKHDAAEAIRFELRQLIQAVEPVDLDSIEDAPSEAPTPAIVGPEIETPIPIPDWPDPPGDLAFYGLAGEVVRLIEPTTEADPVGVLLQLLIGFGNAIGSGLSIVADGHNHHANE